jgi:hypothetical protein
MSTNRSAIHIQTLPEAIWSQLAAISVAEPSIESKGAKGEGFATYFLTDLGYTVASHLNLAH